MGAAAQKKKVYIWEGSTASGFLQEITAFVEEAGKLLGLDNHILFRVQMAVGEAGANSWEHSYSGKKGKLHLEMERRRGVLEVRLTDWGKPFHPEKAPTPRIVRELDQVNLEGLGLLVMHRAVDEVRFSSDPQAGNTITLRKKLSSRGKKSKKATAGRSA